MFFYTEISHLLHKKDPYQSYQWVEKYEKLKYFLLLLFIIVFFNVFIKLLSWQHNSHLIVVVIALFTKYITQLLNISMQIKSLKFTVELSLLKRFFPYENIAD